MMRCICDNSGEDNSDGPSKFNFTTKYTGKMTNNSIQKTRKAAFKYFGSLKKNQMITIQARSFKINLTHRLKIKIVFGLFINTISGRN